MARISQIAALSGLVSAVAFPSTALAEQRKCETSRAIFPTGQQELVRFVVFISATGTAARVRVVGSGEWTGHRKRNMHGAEMISFETGMTEEGITIGTGGEFLWDIAYKVEQAENRVNAFIGTCEPWRKQ